MDIERSWSLLQTVLDSQRFADTKTGVALAANGLIGTLTIPMVAKAYHTEPMCFAFGVVALLALGVSSGLCLFTLMPRLRTLPAPAESLIYFDDISTRFGADPDGYKAAHLDLIKDGERLAGQVALEVWANSQIAKKKFVSSWWAIALLAVSLLCAGIALFAGGLGL